MIQYSHKRENIEGTLYVDTPSKEQLEVLLTSYKAECEMQFGLAIKSEKDYFNKKIGREIAIKNSLPTVFNLDLCEFKANENLYRFSAFIEHNKNLYLVELYMTTVPQSDRVYLIDSKIQGADEIENYE
jgi:hypothetical protein